LLSSVDARKTFLLKALLSSRSGDDCCVIRPLVRGLWVDQRLPDGDFPPVRLRCRSQAEMH
jgi:hypothetical protein